MTIIDKLKNFAESAHAWILAGMPIVDKKTHTDRLAICSMCKSYHKGECAHCGCIMEAKAWLATAACADPAHPKWPAIKSEN
jgi:hypothetical protein